MYLHNHNCRSLAEKIMQNPEELRIIHHSLINAPECASGKHSGAGDRT